MNLASEDHILARINTFFPDATMSNGIVLGRGDDCAVLHTTTPICISTDLFMEDVHFRRAYFSPEDIGWKALAVNLSDLAAMGALPIGFTVGMTLPSDADTDLLDGICKGMSTLASLASFSGLAPIPLLGGDLSKANHLHLCLTVFGQSNYPLKRRMALPGDLIFLLGQIGLARTGMQLLESTLIGEDTIEHIQEIYPKSATAHLHPIPQIIEGMILSTQANNLEASYEEPLRIGLMDVSDGLARDLPRLVQEGQGAKIYLPQANTEIEHYLRQSRKYSADKIPAAVIHQMYLGGEDYALVGTCEPRCKDVLLNAMQEIVFIGKVTDDGRFFCNNVEYSKTDLGFDHFAR